VGAEQLGACPCHFTGSTVGERYCLMARAALASHETMSSLQAGDAHFQGEEAQTAGVIPKQFPT